MITLSRRTAFVIAAVVLVLFVALLQQNSQAQAPASVPEPVQPEIPVGVVLARAELRPLSNEVQLVGSVTHDQDHYAVVGPIVSGRVAALRAKLGSEVKAGETLAEVESPEVGAARGEYLAATARAAAATANLHRESDLAEQHISSARDRELAEAQASQETTAVLVATQRLKTLGLDPKDFGNDSPGGRVALRSPISGTVVSRRVALGQSVSLGDDAFTIADLHHL